jgi:hypothetical protein
MAKLNENQVGCLKQIKKSGNPGAYTGRTTRHLIDKGLVTKDCSKVTAKGEAALSEK